MMHMGAVLWEVPMMRMELSCNLFESSCTRVAVLSGVHMHLSSNLSKSSCAGREHCDVPVVDCIPEHGQVWLECVCRLSGSLKACGMTSRPHDTLDDAEQVPVTRKHDGSLLICMSGR